MQNQNRSRNSSKDKNNLYKQTLQNSNKNSFFKYSPSNQLKHSATQDSIPMPSEGTPKIEAKNFAHKDSFTAEICDPDSIGFIM